MANRPWSVMFTACVGAALAFPQSATIPPNAMLDGTRPAQAEPPRPVLTAEGRGDIYMARKMYREAIEAFKEGSPKDPVLRNKIGIAYHQLMQLGEAKKYYQQAIKLKPTYSEAINNLGTVYYAPRATAARSRSTRRRLNWRPTRPRSTATWARLTSRARNGTRPLEEFQQALRARP